MLLQGMLSRCVKLVLSLSLFFPIFAYAQILSVSETIPFPAVFTVGTSATATYTVTNVTARTTVTAVNQSSFPGGSGLSVSGSTCGNPMGPGQSCTIQLHLDAASAQTINTALKIWAKPTADGVRTPINITVNNPIITPAPGANGTISPATPVPVTPNGSYTFTAVPNAGYAINQWFVDGVLAQTGGTTFVVNNVTTDHTVSATFLASFTITPSTDGSGNGTIVPSTVQNVAIGQNSPLFTASANTGYVVNQWLVDGVVVQTGGTTYTVPAVTADHNLEVTFIAQWVVTPGTTPASGSGTISPGTPQTVNNGTLINFTATPAAGYSVYAWYLDGAPTPAQLGGTTYSLTNITSAHTVNVTFNAPPVIAAGADFTNSPYPPMVAVSTDTGSTWNYKQTISGTGMPATGHFSAASCAGMTNIAACIAAGDTSTPKTASTACTTGTSCSPILIASTDAGNTWIPKIPAGVPTSGTYSAADCSGNGATAACVAAGQIYAAGAGGAPFLVNSIDGANTWVTPTITGAPTIGAFNAASCTGDAPNALCIAAGQALPGGAPVLAVSSVNLTTWAVIAPTGTPPTNGAYFATSCTPGILSNVICIAAGQNIATLDTVLAVSTNGGTAWAVQNVNGNPATSVYHAASCSGVYPNSVCITAGQNLTTNAPLIAVSNDGAAATFTAVTTITGAPANGVFNAASCTGAIPHAVCIAAGQILPGGAPFIAYSNDGRAVTWQVASIGSLPANGTLVSAKCTGSNNTAVCSAAGLDITGVAPLLLTSNNSGVAWTIKTVTGAPAITSGTFFGTAASGGNFCKPITEAAAYNQICKIQETI